MIKRFIRNLKRFILHPLFYSFYLPSLMFAVALGLRTPILPLYAGELTNQYSWIGIVVAGTGLGTLIADLPAGNLIRKMDKRSAMIAGLGLEAVSTLALIWVRSIWLALALRVIGGFGIAVYSVARHTYITGVVSRSSRGRAISLFGGISRIGLFVGPAIGGVLASNFGLKTPFAIYAMICTGTMAVIFFAKGRFDHSVSSPDSLAVKNTGLGGALKGRWVVFLWASLGHILAQVTRAGQSLILPLYAADVLSLAPDKIGFVVSLSAAVSMTLFYPVGLIMDRLGRKLTIVPSFLLMGLGLALIPLTEQVQGLLMVAALIGLGHGMGSGTMMTLGADLSPKEGRSAYLGAWRWIGDIGQSSGPLLVGLVADLLVLPYAALVIALAGFLAGGVFSFFVPETLRKKMEP